MAEYRKTIINGRNPISRKLRNLLAVGAIFAFTSQAIAEPPAYYPTDYSTTIEGSKSEAGLLIYSNISVTAWDPIIKAFNAEYPWITVQTTR